MTAGLRSSELWLTVVTIVGLDASALAGALSPHWAAVASAIASAAYALARGLAKQGTVPPPPAVPPVVPPAKP